MNSLAEIAREVLTPLAAPASFVCSQLIGPDEPEGDVDEWVALDAAVARRIAAAGQPIVLRWPARDLKNAPRLQNLTIEAVVEGQNAAALAEAIGEAAIALAAGLGIRAVLAAGDTGIDCYRAAAAARRTLGTAVPIRARWDAVLDVKGAALALTFGADEIAGPLAPEKERWKLAQIGGPAEDGSKPSPAYVESLIKAAGRLPARRR
jgi:hypothetical protein